MVENLTEVEKQHYRFGACHVFALALHLELGYAMNFFWNRVPDMDNLDEENPECLIHAYAVSPNGKLYDVDGETDFPKIERIYSKPVEEKTVIESKESVEKLMESGILWLGDEEEITYLCEYIRKYKEIYKE